ncbi:MAG: hypothetical protein AB7G06_04125 [Bdellovibrionales bacterium]
MASLSHRLRFSVALVAMLVASGCANATSAVDVPEKPSQVLQLPKGYRAADNDFDAKTLSTIENKAPKTKATSFSSNDPLAQVQDNPTGTFVGQRTHELMVDIARAREVIETRDNTLQEIRRDAAQAAVTYHSSVAAVEARLQAGTTPGNPILLKQWDEAQANLDTMNSSINRLNTLSTEVSADASMVGYLLGSVKAAFQLNGAIDEDHENLRKLQEVVTQQIYSIEQTKTAISEDLLRLNSYVSTERNNLQTLAFGIDRGEYLGNNLANRPIVAGPSPAVYSRPAPPPMADVPFDPYSRTGVATGTADTSFGMLPTDSAVAAGADPTMPVPAPTPYMAPVTQNLDALPSEADNRMLALIRFNKPDVQFEKQLYDAVSNALDQMPAAVFTVMAVAPDTGNAADVANGTAEAQRHADAVKRSLISMGLPPNRIAMAAQGSKVAEVPEVHVMVR